MKIVVFDDDPTGSQTVHNCPLLLCWEVDVLRAGLRHASPIFFVLANTRALLPEIASARNREVCDALRKAMAAEGFKRNDVLLVSRGDSTLRGHGFLEPRVIAEELGPFAATFHVPAFLEGGRTTVNGVHLLNKVPVHKTAFAHDRLFGYTTSKLAAWLEEKSSGAIKEENVERVTLTELDAAIESNKGFSDLKTRFRAFQNNQHVVVDAERSEQLLVLGNAVRQLSRSKRFLFRSAASMLNGLSNVDSQLLKVEARASLRRIDNCGVPLPGMVLVGSHVPLSDLQLEKLLQDSRCEGLELCLVKVVHILNEGAADLFLPDLQEVLISRLSEILAKGRTPVFFTSRGELEFPSPQRRVAFGRSVAHLMARVVGALAPKLGYLISKGGITTNSLLSYGFGLKKVHLEGQILPGLSVVKISDDGPLNNLPVLTFPGNLGDPMTLLESWRLMES